MLPSSTVLTPKNPRSRAVTKLCLALESFRRTDEGRVRDAKSFLGFYLPYEAGKDRLFVHVPTEVRADLLSNWGVRGKKSALRDDDEKVRTTLADALAAGDIDAAVIESGVTPEILVDWAPLEDWWSFWRGSALPTGAIRKALATARELELFDEKWFFHNLSLKSQKLDGTDVVCAALSKEQVAAWLLSIHASGDASPAGLVRAVGWDTILGKTAHEALLFVLDALAVQVGLAGPSAGAGARPPPSEEITPRPPSLVASLRPVSVKPVPGPKTEPAPAPVPAKPEPTTKVDAAKKAADVPPASASSPAVVKPAVKSSAAAPVAAKVPPAAASTPKLTSPFVAKPTPPLVPSRPPPVPAKAVEVPKPVESAPPSSPLTARALFGAPQPPVAAPPAPKPTSGGPGPMRPKALTLAGVGGELPMFGDPLDPPDPPPSSAIEVAVSTFKLSISSEAPSLSGEEPAWAPPRAEPGDMGWDLVHGVERPLTTNVQPKYNLEEDDETTSEISLPGDPHRA